MKRTRALFATLLLAANLQASSGGKVAMAAAVSTLTVNLLEIKTTTAKAVKAWKATRKVTVKVAKKVAGK